MNKKEKKEKIQRTASALGIIVASIIGFALNVFANMYYDVFVTGNKQFSDMNTFSIAVLCFVLMYAMSFLQFLVYDYENELNLDRSFWGRYLYYDENVFWLTKIFNRINSVTFSIVKWLFIILSTYIILASFGWIMAILWIIFIFQKRILMFVNANKYGK